MFQGEKLLVGGVLGLEVLGSYAIAAQLALLPVMIAGRLSIGLGLPVLARAGADTRRGLQAREDVIQLFVAGGMLFWLGFVALAPLVIAAALRRGLCAVRADMSWIAAAAALRLQKTGPCHRCCSPPAARATFWPATPRGSPASPSARSAWSLTRDLTVFLAAAAAGRSA